MESLCKKEYDRVIVQFPIKNEAVSLVEKIEAFSEFLHQSQLPQKVKNDFSNKLLDILSDDKHQALKSLEQSTSMVDCISRALVATAINQPEDWYRYEKNVFKQTLDKINRQKPPRPDKISRAESFDTISSEDEEENNDDKEMAANTNFFANQAKASEPDPTTSNQVNKP